MQLNPRDRRLAAITVAAVFSSALGSCANTEALSAVAVAHAKAVADVSDDNQHSAAGETSAFIGGWVEGEVNPVALRYTRSYFCEEPPPSAASDTDCELGAPAETYPRPGHVPKMYALAPAFQPAPDPSTVHCPGGTVCPNHPPHLDASRVGGSANTAAPAHSHIITSRQGGWHETVNIRIASLAVWNQIAYEPNGRRLAKVRELQADSSVGGKGLISQDRPTNIFFFFDVQPSAKP
jgi:hypothetical protein